MRDEIRPTALAIKCKQCPNTVTVVNAAAVSSALRHGILCADCRGGVERKWTKATYADYLKSDHWQHTRAKALRRAGYKCQLCAATEHLETHHNTYERLGGEKPTDLVVLCGECHKTHHGIEY